jgi:hypothetical protein
MDEMIQNAPPTNPFTIGPVAATPVAPSVAGSVYQLGANSNASFLSEFSQRPDLGPINQE